jgi:hypothetical protein
MSVVEGASGGEPAAKRNARGRNFKAKDDVRLATSWLHISQDPVAGNDQRIDTFWARIADHFNDDKGADDPDYRTASSLQSRWSPLQATVSKFAGVWQSLQNEEHSGWAPDDYMKEAMSRYEDRSAGNASFKSLGKHIHRNRMQFSYKNNFSLLGDLEEGTKVGFVHRPNREEGSCSKDCRC